MRTTNMSRNIKGSKVSINPRTEEKSYTEYGTYTTGGGETKQFKKTIPYEKAVEIGRVQPNVSLPRRVKPVNIQIQRGIMSMNAPIQSPKRKKRYGWW